LKTYELSDYLLSLNGEWVVPENTVNNFKAGNPENENHGIAVGWMMSYTSVIKKVYKLNSSVFITQETCRGYSPHPLDTLGL